MIQGQLVEIARKTPQPTKEAVPRVFPVAPQNLTKPAPLKRNERNLCDQTPIPPKKRKRQISAEATSAPSEHLDDTTRSLSSTLADNFSGPEASPWTNVDLGKCDELTFACCHMNDDGSVDSVLVSRRVAFDFKATEGSTERATAYIRGKRFKTQDVETVQEAEHLLSEVGSLQLRPGNGVKPTSKSFQSWNGCYFSEKCSLVSQTVCVGSRYLRLTTNTLSRRKRTKTTSTKTASKRRALLHTKKRLLQAEQVIAQLKTANEQISNMEFGKRISGLPLKQQLAVRACFDAAKRKSAKGARYTDEYLLELMKCRYQSTWTSTQQIRMRRYPFSERIALYFGTCLPSISFIMFCR